MLGFTAAQRYYLSRQAADMRKSYDGLSGLVRQGLGRDPLSGEVFIFLNRRRTQMKLLVWDRSGFVIWGKRLERGTFELPRSSEAAPKMKLEWEHRMTAFWFYQLMLKWECLLMNIFSRMMM